ncbi:D-glycero-alpha-D-manno-heptose-1,7-bisphosphate 7-phosphatase [Bacillus salitolerans]|uniref:D,D-heptose 1,7-bisphosphate phosphatase n=1 Tax=Bacillus salitolerans TaxID=1437434 RepID=A0ABW4LJV8_9BACI
MKKAIFLDRDGVINEVLTKRVKFVNKPKDLYLLPRVGEAIKLLNDAGFLVFVVTNQGGIGLGYMTEEALQKVHHKMEKELSKAGASIQEVAYCPHKPEAGCECRKPNSKMLFDLAKRHGLDLGSSYMVGDREVDIMAGKGAGVKTIIVGKEKTELADYRFPSLYEAAVFITKRSE